MERVLIVDDDPDILRLVSYNLTQAGFDVATAATGRKALESVQKRQPDLIILDLMLPDIDGMEVCRTLRQRDDSRRIPIVILTAADSEEAIRTAYELHANCCVTKPADQEQYVQAVKKIAVDVAYQWGKQQLGL